MKTVKENSAFSTQKKIRLDLADVIGFSAVMLAGLLILTYGITHESIWSDEAYSASLIRHGFKELWKINALDSHPPLYFIALKLFCMVFGSSIFTLRFFSVLGTLAVAALGFGPVRRVFGKTAGMVFAIISITTPIMVAVSQDTRMYSWAVFCVTGCFLYAHLSMRENKALDWIRFGAFALACTYTHYYALMATGFIGIAVLVWAIFSGRDRLKPYFITVSIAVICYIPWIFNAISQAKWVSKEFWIPPVTPFIYFTTFAYPYCSKWTGSAFSVIAFVVSSVLAGWGIIRSSKEGKSHVSILSFSMAVYILTITTGVLISYLVRPIYVQRYAVPMFGLFFLVLAAGLANLKNKYYTYIACVLVVVLCIPQIIDINSKNFNGPMHEVLAYTEKEIGPNDVFIHYKDSSLGPFSYYFPGNRHYMYLAPGRRGYTGYAAYEPQSKVIDDINDAIGGSRNIWLVKIPDLPPEEEPEWLKQKFFVPIGEEKVFQLPESIFAFVITKVQPGNVK